MEIEEHWNDGIIYEVKYKIVASNQHKFFYCLICCFENLEENYIRQILKKNRKIRFKNCECIHTNELYDVLIDKQAVVSKIQGQLKLGTLFKISFSTCQNNRERIIEKMILFEKNTSHYSIINTIKNKFSNVEEVISIQRIENIMIIV